MAASTTFTTEKIYDTDGKTRYMYAKCTQTYEEDKNRSKISWTIYAKGGTSTYYSTGPTTLIINGKTVYSKERTYWDEAVFPAKAGSISSNGTTSRPYVYINHEADGSAPSIKVSLKTAIYTASVSTETGTWELVSYPRLFSETPELSVLSRTETSMEFQWDTSEGCLAATLFYKEKASEESYIEIPIHELGTSETMTEAPTTGTYELINLKPNTEYDCYINATRWDTGQSSDSDNYLESTYAYPYVNSVKYPSLQIGGDPQVVNLYNPLNRAVSVSMYQCSQNNSDPVILFKTINIVNSTEETQRIIRTVDIKEDMFKSIPNSTTGYCVFLTTSVTGIEPQKSEIYNYYIGEEDAVQLAPTVPDNSISIVDTITDLREGYGELKYSTKPEDIFIQSISKPKITFPTDVAAIIPQQGATIQSYQLIGLGINKIYSFDSNKIETELFTEAYNNAGDQVVKLIITDSRGYQTEISKTINFRAYVKPTILLTGGRPGNYGTDVKLTLAYATSSIKDEEDEINLSNIVILSQNLSTNNEWTLLSDESTQEAGNKTLEKEIKGIFDNEAPYMIKAIITDNFNNSAEALIKIDPGLPIFFVDVEQQGIGVETFPLGQGAYINGDIVMMNQSSGKGTNAFSVFDESGNSLLSITAEGIFMQGIKVVWQDNITATAEEEE